MSAPKSPKAAQAAARVLAGERKAQVSRETGVSRSTIDRHLAAMAAEVSAEPATAPEVSQASG